MEKVREFLINEKLCDNNFLLYLRCSSNEELLLNRINKINQDTSSVYYKSLQKIKKRS